MAKTVNAALLKELTPTGPLAELIGSNPVSRGQAIKAVWDHIKKSAERDTSKTGGVWYKTSDEKLANLLGKSFKMTDVGGPVSKNLK